MTIIIQDVSDTRYVAALGERRLDTILYISLCTPECTQSTPRKGGYIWSTEMAITNIVSRRSPQAMQLRAIFPRIAEFEAKWDPANVLSNGEQTETITVQGVRPGDFVMVSVASDLQSLFVVANVSANDTIKVTLVNPTNGAVDLGEVDLHFVVLRPYHRHAG